MLASVRHDRLSFDLKSDSIVSNQVKYGKFGIDINVLPSNITGNLFLSNEADSILHMIDVEAERKNELVVFKSATPNWIINKIPYALSPMKFLS